jgi:hypothetical protein
MLVGGAYLTCGQDLISAVSRIFSGQKVS